MTANPPKNDWTPTTWEEILKEFQEIEIRLSASESGMVCFVYGMGGGTHKLYQEIGYSSGCDVIWTRSLISPLLFFLRPFIASVEGLVRIVSPQALIPCFEALGACGTVTIIIADMKNASRLVEALRSEGNWTGIAKLLATGMPSVMRSYILDLGSSPNEVLKKHWDQANAVAAGK